MDQYLKQTLGSRSAKHVAQLASLTCCQLIVELPVCEESLVDGFLEVPGYKPASVNNSNLQVFQPMLGTHSVCPKLFLNINNR